MADESAKDNAEKPAEAPAAKSNTLLMVIIAVLATLLVAAVGFGAYVMTHQSSAHVAADAEDAPPAEGGEVPAKKQEAKKKDSKKKDEPKDPAIYVSLEPPFVVNFDPKQSARFLQITLDVMTRDQPTSQLLKDNNPLLRNNLLLLFGTQEPAVIGTRDGKEALRKQALDAVREVARSEGGKPEKVEAVYFTSFVMQ
jgi:flagellar protein FliL